MANWCRNGVATKEFDTNKNPKIIIFGRLNKSTISYRNMIDNGLILVPECKRMEGDMQSMEPLIKTPFHCQEGRGSDCSRIRSREQGMKDSQLLFPLKGLILLKILQRRRHITYGN